MCSSDLAFKASQLGKKYGWSSLQTQIDFTPEHPKGPMGRDMIKKLHVYAGAEHANQAQKPEVLTF